LDGAGERLFASRESWQGAQDIFGFRADAEVGVGLSVEYFALWRQDVGGWQGQLPALVPVDERDVQQNAPVVALQVRRDGPDEAELFGDGAARVGEEREGDAVLAGGEVALTLGLGRDADDQGAALAQTRVQVAPGLELGDAVGAPASAEEIHNHRAEGEQVSGTNDLAGKVRQGEAGGSRADGEDAVFDAGREQLLDRAFADGEAFGLNQGPGLGGDLVKLVLEVRHDLSVDGGSQIGAEELWMPGYDGGRAAILWCQGRARWGLRKEGMTMTMRGSRVRWAGLAVLLCGMAAAWGQGYTPVTVVVTDPSGAAIPGAEISVTPGSPAGDKLIADDQGHAQLGMPAGEYKLHITAQGFLTGQRALTVGDKPQTLTVVIEPAPPASGGTVSPGAAGMQPSAVPLESTIEKPHAEGAGSAGASEQPAATLTIVGTGGLRGVFTPESLREYPQQTVTIFDHHTNKQETYGGVPLIDLLAKLGVAHGKDLMGKALGQYVVATGSDGYRSVVALGEVDPEFHPGTVLIADTMDGKPLDEKAGPFRLVVTEDKRPARSVRNLVKVELRTVE
jgi:hypothetical protein